MCGVVDGTGHGPVALILGSDLVVWQKVTCGLLTKTTVLEYGPKLPLGKYNTKFRSMDPSSTKFNCILELARSTTQHYLTESTKDATCSSKFSTGTTRRTNLFRLH